MEPQITRHDDGYHLRKFEEANDPNGAWFDVPPGQRPTCRYFREARLVLRPESIHYGPVQGNPYYRW